MDSPQQPLDDQIDELIDERISAVLERRRTRDAQRSEMAVRRAVGLAKRHAANLDRTKETAMPPTPTYLTEVRSFDHAKLAAYPAYPALRQAINDLANEASGNADMKLRYWLDAVRDMALTTPYGDMCSKCTRQCSREHERSADGTCPCGAHRATYWPHAAKRDGNWIRGAYRCPNGHEWTCGYAVDVMRYL